MTAAAKNKRLHAYVSGRVQGVFFRSRTQDKALSLELMGWVRNLPDGRVEIVAEGDEQVLHQLLEWVRRGPSPAHVMDVAFNFEPASNEFASFDISY